MIRINLLGQVRPKAARRPVDTGAALPIVFVGAGLVLGGIMLAFFYFTAQKQLSAENDKIKTLKAQKAELQQIKAQVEQLDAEKKLLQVRVDTIEKLQRDRPGGQELLDMVANTVSRTENLWLTGMSRKSDVLYGQSASSSSNSVANFISAIQQAC